MRLVRNVVRPIAFGIAITPAIKWRANYSQFDWVTRPEIETSSAGKTALTPAQQKIFLSLLDRMGQDERGFVVKKRSEAALEPAGNAGRLGSEPNQIVALI